MKKIYDLIIKGLIVILLGLPQIGQATISSTSSEEVIADVAEHVIPSVVNIYTTQHKQSKKSIHRFGFPFDQFNEFFDQFDLPDIEEMYSDPKAQALGSGFIVDKEGYIITNHHVVKRGDEIMVKLHDNTEIPAKIVGTDPKTDIALLKIDSSKPLQPVKFGDSDKLRVGQRVIAVGNPMGLSATVTSGIVSSKSRDINLNASIVDNFIQTDAAINPGNSGGPMFNLSGEVVGVNTAIISNSAGGNIGIGFAIPSNIASNIMEQLKKHGKVKRGLLGIMIQDISPDIAEGLDIKDLDGVLVVGVINGGSGDKAGVKVGDVIVEYAGKLVKNTRKLNSLVGETAVNSEVQIVVLRNHEKKVLTVKIVEADKQPTIGSGAESLEKNGIVFSNVTPEIRQKWGIPENMKGVFVIGVERNSNIRSILSVGDLVIAVNQTYINSVEEFEKIYQNAKSNNKRHIVLFVKRKKTMTLFVPFPIS